jgi:hypothetical protein
LSKLILIGALSAGLAAGAVLGKPIANVSAKKQRQTVSIFSIEVNVEEEARSRLP